MKQGWEDVRAWREGQAWATNVVLCALGVGLVMLARQLVRENQGFEIGFSGVSGWSAVLYVAAVLVMLTQPVDRLTLWIVLGFGLAFRCVVLMEPPFLSSDIYRYVWDGVVQHTHVSPYRYVPGDEALRALREPHADLFANMNRRDYARTIYPPVAQMIYWVATLFSPTVTAMKVTMMAFEGVSVATLMALLRRMGKPREQVLLYAWCPLLVWEVGDAGHVDAAVIAFVCLALLARSLGKNLWTGVALGLAVMTKFYPLVLLPALWRRGDWKMPAAVAAVVAAGYAIYASAGRLVFGFAGGYVEEEGLASGTRFFLLEWARRFVTMPQWEYFVLCAVALGAICWWAWRNASQEGPIEVRALRAEAPAFLRAGAGMALALMLLFSPHYPWYIIWLIPFFALMPRLPMLAYLMGFFYLFTTELADPGPKMFLLNEILYGVTLAAFLLQWMMRSAGRVRWIREYR